jgi:beta-lactamase class C
MRADSKHTHPMPATKVTNILIARAAACALAFLTASVAAQPATTTVTVSPAKAASRDTNFAPEAHAVDAVAQELLDRSHIPGMAVAIVQGDKVLLMKGYGVTEAGGGEPVGVHTVFRLASLSKGFAATLTALLVQDGVLGWDMRIADHLPAFKLANLQDTQSLTVRDILSQRAGLTHNTYDRDLEADVPFELLVERLANAPMACAPGECYGYQNVSFSLIGDIVFAQTGDFYTHQVEKRIFNPLGMADSSYGRDALESSPSWARPHVRGGGGWTPIRPQEAYYRIPPAAGVNTSINDMTQWLIAQMGHRPDVLSPAVLADVHKPQVPSPDQLHGAAWRRERLSSAYYATGWRVFDYAGHTLIFHGGAVRGFRSEIGFLPDRDIGAVILWNSESAAPSGLMPTILDRALGLPERDWIELDKINERVASNRHHDKSRKAARGGRRHRR